MIYLVSENYFLFNGIEKLIPHQKIELITTKDLNADLLRTMVIHDLLLIDTGSCSTDIVGLLPDANNNSDIVFITRVRKENIRYGSGRYSPCSLSLDVPLKEFQSYVLEKQEGEVFVGNISTILTKREVDILRDSLHGLPTQKIAHSYGINIKTVYAHIKSACHKLGINKITDSLPFIAWITSRQENTSDNTLTGSCGLKLSRRRKALVRRKSAFPRMIKERP